jgi:hypothetical protein
MNFQKTLKEDEKIMGDPEIVVYLKDMPNPNSSTPPYPERGFNQERFREIEEPPLEAEEIEVEDELCV